MRTFWRVMTVLSVLCGVATRPASAEEDLPPEFPVCQRQPTLDEVRRAQWLHKQAAKAWSEDDNAQAIEWWLQAYRLDCNAHHILLNLSKVYEDSGEYKAAIAALETYLWRFPPDERRSREIGVRIVSLREKIEAQKKAAKAPVTVPPPSASPPPASPPTASPLPSPARPTPLPAPKPVPISVVSSRPSTAPWIVTGLGAAIAVGGGVLLPLGLSGKADVSASCPNRLCTSQDSVDAGNRASIEMHSGAVMLGLGVSLTAIGLAWGFGALTPTPQKTGAGQMRVTPFVGSSAQGVAAIGTF